LTRFVPLFFTQEHNAISVRVPRLYRKQVRVSIEYELRAPSCYANDWHHVAYPLIETEEGGNISFARPTLRGVPSIVAGRHMPKDSDDFLQLACRNNAPKALVAKWATEQLDREPTINLRASWETMRVPDEVDGELNFGRLKIEAAAQLSDAQKRAQFVFVLDASHSAHDPKLSEQLKIVRGLLHHVPDAEVQIVLMQRHATLLFEDFVSARRINRALSRARSALVAANGSNVEQALALANKLLAGREGPLRVIAIGDGK
jgi:hypothetical protein